jgi:hypothetical protein
MTLIPDLERELVDAASRLTAPRRRLRLYARLGAVPALAAIVVATVVIGQSDSGQRSTANGAKDRSQVGVECPLGREPTAAKEWKRGDPRLVRALVVLGCERLWDGRRFELVARSFRREGLCLDVYVPASRAALECAALARPRGGIISVSAYAQPSSTVAERLGGTPLVTGSASAAVARIELRYRSRGVERRRLVPLVRVRSPRLLSAATQKQQFGVFAFVPPKSLRMVRGLREFAPHLTAFGEDGGPLPPRNDG